MHRPPSVLDAPSNLGLHPPAPGVTPGCYKLAGALRDHRLLPRLGALLASDRCAGLEVTVFDPDLDPDGRPAGELTDTLVAAFG